MAFAGGRQTPTKMTQNSVLFHLDADGTCSFDCPACGRPTFAPLDGPSTVLDANAVAGLDAANSVRRPNKCVELVLLIVGIVVLFILLAASTVFPLVGIIGVVLLVLFTVGVSGVQYLQLQRFLRELEVALRQQPSSSGSWHIHTNQRCDHSFSCMNGYRTFCCRKDIFLEYVPPQQQAQQIFAAAPIVQGRVVDTAVAVASVPPGEAPPPYTAFPAS